MPITIKTGSLKFKDPDTGKYVGIDVAAETKVSQQLASIEAAGEAQVASITQNGEAQMADITENGESQMADITQNGQSQVAAIQTAGQTQVSNIETKGAETLDSIPDDYTDLYNDVGVLKSVLNSTNSNLEDLAENGYYTEITNPEDVYLTLTTGFIRNTDGTISADITKGYIWLTTEQEQLAIKIDTTVYAYSYIYMNGDAVTKYTLWLDSSPLMFDSTSETAHDKVGVVVKKLAGGDLRNELSQILYYTTGSQTDVGNLATKNYAVAKQQSVSDAGKALVIGNDGIVTPGNPSVATDSTLSEQDKAADAKATGDAITELAENGYIEKTPEYTYFTLTSGMCNGNSNVPVSDTIQASVNTGYVNIPKAQIPDALYYDNTKYKVNTVFIKNNYQISGTYTAWQTTSPVQYSAPIDYDSILLNVRKLSGDFTTAELGEALYKVTQEVIGNLATKSYVDEQVASVKPKGIKQIYPDGFTSRIMPDIYFNGQFVADIDTDDYKISGTGIAWVATDGIDTTGDGTETNPYATITKALTTAAITIKLKAGTYSQGTHYSTTVDLKNRNWIGIGNVVLQDDSDGHSLKTTGSAYFENIVFKHGNSDVNAAFFAMNSASDQLVCFVGCTFRDGGGNGLSLTGIDAILVNCLAFGNKLDGFNYHDKTISSVVYTPNVLEIDCKGYNNGSSASGNDSCNGSTAHDGSKIIRLNGEYYSCYGGVIAEIARTGEEPTISVNYGVLAHDSTGTGTYKASFWASINTQMYLYDCSSYGGTYDISAINDAKIVSWRLTTGRDEPSVNEASTATVIQH